MIKNIIIVVQALILAFVAVWAHFYQHRVEQIFLSEEISNLANEARFKIKIAERIESGQPDDAKRMLRNVAASNITLAKESMEKLDLRMEDLAADAEHSAKMLEEIGVPALSESLQERKSALAD